MKKLIFILLCTVSLVQVKAQDPQGPPPRKNQMGQEQMMEKRKMGQVQMMERRKMGGNKRIELLKIQFINKKLALTTEEAEKFWPVYEENKLAVMEIIKTKMNDEILLQEAMLNAKKKYRNNLKPILKTDDRLNEALKVDREFLKTVRGEMMKRKQVRS